MTKPTVTLPREVVKQAIDALDNSQEFVEASSNAKLRHGWGNQLDEAEKAIAFLRAALDAPAPTLQDSEQYRIQMAGICTAALGYWKPGDAVHADYDTLAMRDVAALYAKYDKLFQAIRKACNELGVPGEGYPAPVTNAVDILKAAIDPFALDAPAKPVDCRGCRNFYTNTENYPFTYSCGAEKCTNFDKFQALPPIVLTKVTK